MHDLRDELRALDPELHGIVDRLWPERDRVEYVRQKLASAMKRRPAPPVGDEHARATVGGVAGNLLWHGVKPWLSRELAHCYNEARVMVPLDASEVEELVNRAASVVRRRRDAA